MNQFSLYKQRGSIKTETPQELTLVKTGPNPSREMIVVKILHLLQFKKQLPKRVENLGIGIITKLKALTHKEKIDLLRLIDSMLISLRAIFWPL